MNSKRKLSQSASVLLTVKFFVFRDEFGTEALETLECWALKCPAANCKQ